jgi:hypothetical protein
MAKIFPFRALRYNPEKVSISEVVTQPYDKISAAMQDRYYNASPHNLVRVILGKAESGDNDQNSIYSRAASHLKGWQADGVVVRDSDPSIYLYTQTFTVPGDPTGKQLVRKGFIAHQLFPCGIARNRKCLSETTGAQGFHRGWPARTLRPKGRFSA